MQDFMKRSLDTIKYNIKLTELWIEQRIAESIAENLRRDSSYDVLSYVNAAYDVMAEAGINSTWAKKIMNPAIHQAYELDLYRKRTGKYAFHNGSGAHPRIVIGEKCDELTRLMQLLMTTAMIAVTNEDQ